MYKYTPLARSVLLAGLFWGCAHTYVSAQFLRIGNFNFNSSLNTSLQYSTNPDGLNQDVVDSSEDDVEDLWLTYGASLTVNASYFPRFSLSGSSSVSYEYHFIRDDLDEDNDPSLNFNLSTGGSFSRYRYNLAATREEEITADKEDVVDPNRFSTNNVRDRTSTTSFNGGLVWSFKALSLGANYNYLEERHSKAKESDTDEETTAFDASFAPRIGRFTPSYSFTRNRDITVNAAGVETDPGWEDTQSLNLSYNLLSKPSITLGVGAEKEDAGGEEGEWEPIYTVSASDARQLAPNLNISASADYSYEKVEEKDDVSLVYNVALGHQMPNGWNQSLSFSLEPVDTLGSSQESEETTYTYNVGQPNFILQTLGMNFSVTKEISKPKLNDGTVLEAQETLTYTFSLTKSLPALVPKLNSSFSYNFSREVIENQDTHVDEHIVSVTWSYSL